jgi:hypothetical protein
MKTLTSVNIDEVALQRLYRENRAARAILDHFASRERNWSVTTVDRLLANVTNEGPQISRGDVIDVLKKLEEARCGEFRVGRRGWSSRFVWSVGMVAVGQSAAGEPVEIELVAPEDQGEEAELQLLGHKFQLRPDLAVSIDLPRNLTATEASRLADFIRTLPFVP